MLQRCAKPDNRVVQVLAGSRDLLLPATVPYKFFTKF